MLLPDDGVGRIRLLCQCVVRPRIRRNKVDCRRTLSSVSGCLAGSCLTLVALAIFAGLFHSRAERQLIDEWRRIGPGMNREAVMQRLREPSYAFEPGEANHTWSQPSIPAEYFTIHDLLVFSVPGPGPHLLLVFFDANSRVSFVSRTHI